MSEETKRNLHGKFGPTVLDKSGDYGSIKSNGPFTAYEPFSVDEIKVNGPLGADNDVNIENGKINGPSAFDRNLKVTGVFKTNGPLSVDGNLEVSGRVHVNGPVKVQEGISSENNDSSFSVNGPLETPSIMGVQNILIRGILESDIVDGVRSLKVMGKVKSESVKAREIKILLLNDLTKIQTLEADSVEIGTELEDEDLKIETKSRFFNRLINRAISKESGYAEIDEIRSSGTVEIDHVKVKKVYAKELFVGEDTEVGEFIEVKKVE